MLALSSGTKLKVTEENFCIYLFHKQAISLLIWGSCRERAKSNTSVCILLGKRLR